MNGVFVLKRTALLLVALFSLMASPALAQSGDPLTDAINVVRAGYGLQGLVFDGNLSAWASQNNSYGFGHFVMGPAMRQNAAWGIHDVQGVVSAWMASPGHRAALLDATITTSGGSYDGTNWTWNAAAGAPAQGAVMSASACPPAGCPPSQSIQVAVQVNAYQASRRPMHCGFHPFRGLFRCFRGCR